MSYTFTLTDNQVNLLDELLHSGMQSGIDGVERGSRLMHKLLFEDKQSEHIAIQKPVLESMEIRALHAQHYRK